MKKTKIISTFGPSIAKTSLIRKLVDSGVNTFRVNCSHGTTSDFVKASDLIRKATLRSEYPVGLLFDISGPKLRLDRFEGSLAIKKGEKITISESKTSLNEKIISVNHPKIVRSLKAGETVFIDDGYIMFTVDKVSGGKAILKAENKGTIYPGKGINLPNTNLPVETITAKDKADIATAVKLGADFIALSFVRSGDDIIKARKLINKGKGHQKIIAKLEKREAIDNLDEIMLLSDGVMIARGDLGVEMPPAELPKIQKKIIKLANRHHKPVIVATQMLESMRTAPRATRAEINDVASAVFDYVDAVMLSAETASGSFPVDAVTTMNDVINASEGTVEHEHADFEEHLMKSPIPHAIAGAVSNGDKYCETKVIFAFTTSGYTAGLISNLYPKQPVIALTPDVNVMRQVSLFRSVYAVKITQPKSFPDMLKIVQKVCKKHKLADKGDRVIITGGVPFGSTAPTNFMMYQEVS